MGEDTAQGCAPWLPTARFAADEDDGLSFFGGFSVPMCVNERRGE